MSSNKCEIVKTETGNRSGIQTSFEIKVCTRRRSWVQQTVDQRRRVVVARLGLQLGVEVELNSLILC